MFIRKRIGWLLWASSPTISRSLRSQNHNFVKFRRSIYQRASFNTMSANEDTERIKVLVFAGPTAVGKSSLALEICKSLGGELISSDSVQVYKGLNIGSNKASLAERNMVPHHLLDVIDPNEKFTAGKFVREAHLCIDDIAKRGKVPVICGGTPLYLQWLVHGVPGSPASDPELALQIAQKLYPLEREKNWEGGLALLRELDTEKADNLIENDWYRLGRALEIATARKESMIDNEEEKVRFKKKKEFIQQKYDFRCFFLCPDDRWGLFEKIDERCESMMIGSNENKQYLKNDVNNFSENDTVGILQETAVLLSNGQLQQWCMAGRAIGYRQTIDYLLRPIPPSSSSSSSSSFLSSSSCDMIPDKLDHVAFNEYFNNFCTATRNYASQQIKWFRKDPAFMFLEINFLVRNPPVVPKQKNQSKFQQPKISKETGSFGSNDDNVSGGGGGGGDVSGSGGGIIKNKKRMSSSSEDNMINDKYEQFEAMAFERKQTLIQNVIKFYHMSIGEFKHALNSTLQLDLRSNILKQGKKMRMYNSKKWLIQENDKEGQLSNRQKRKKLLLMNQRNDNDDDNDDDGLTQDVKKNKIHLNDIITKADHCTSMVRKAGILNIKDPNVLFRHILPISEIQPPEEVE